MAKNQTSIVLPKGFAPVEASKFPDNHDFRKEPTIQGKITEIKNIPGRQKRRIMYVAVSGGEVKAVWENAMLASLFARARVGQEVFISMVYDGDNEKKKVSEFVTALK